MQGVVSKAYQELRGGLQSPDGQLTRAENSESSHYFPKELSDTVENGVCFPGAWGGVILGWDGG